MSSSNLPPPKSSISNLQSPISNSEPEISLIIPCFNEERRLPATLDRAREYLATGSLSYEILVVDDGSRDGTINYAEGIAAKDPRVSVHSYGENRGKGAAVAYGALRSRGRAVLFSDADLSTPIEELERFLPKLDEGFDIVIASRAMAGSNLAVPQPWYREKLGRGMNWIIRHLIGLEQVDTQCGFKLFSRAAAHDIFSNTTIRGWMFDVEVLVLARKLGYRVAEVPVTWRDSPDSRVHWSHTLRTFRELLKIRAYWLRREPSRAVPEDASLAGRSPL